MKYKLGDICNIVSGSTPKTNISEYWEGNLKWITPAELTDDSYIITDTTRKITELGASKTAINPFPSGTVLLSSRAPIGKVAIAGCEMYCNQGFKNLICSNKIYNKYLFWFLKSKTAFLNSLGRGSTFKEISKQIVSDIIIDLPEFDKQVKMSDVLEEITNLISIKNQQLEQLDLLVKSRFVEMFGDPVKNPNGYPIKNISSLLRDKASNGYFAKRDEYVKSGNAKILGVVNIVNRMYCSVSNLPETNVKEKDIEKYKVSYGDILFCRSSLVAEGIGKASIVPLNIENNILFECHVIRIPLDLSFCVPEFIQVFTTTDFFREQIFSQAKTSTMTTISQDGILKANVVLPPKKLQESFYSFVVQVEKQKSTVKQSLDELGMLKASLMQKYFG